jgi:hypothetical protein
VVRDDHRCAVPAQLQRLFFGIRKGEDGAIATPNRIVAPASVVDNLGINGQVCMPA